MIDYEAFMNQGFDLNEPTDRTPMKTDESNTIKMSNAWYITDEAAWSQYTNDFVYDTDKKLRAWLQEMYENEAVAGKNKPKRFRMNQVWQAIFGVPYDRSNKEHAGHTMMFSKMLAYYSISINTCIYDEKKKRYINKTAYSFGKKRAYGPPFSLKLRLEEMEARGEKPTVTTMALPKDDLQPGHSRNPKTEANKEIRRQKAKEAFNEYQRKRNKRISESKGK